MAGFQILEQVLAWLARSFDELPDDDMSGGGSSQDCRLAIRLTSCCRYFPSVLEKMRYRLIQGRINYSQLYIDYMMDHPEYKKFRFHVLGPLQKTPYKYFAEDLSKLMFDFEVQMTDDYLNKDLGEDSGAEEEESEDSEENSSDE